MNQVSPRLRELCNKNYEAVAEYTYEESGKCGIKDMAQSMLIHAYLMHEKCGYDVNYIHAKIEFIRQTLEEFNKGMLSAQETR